MKLSSTLMRFAANGLFLGTLSALGQGGFQNLNFEAALVPQSQAPGLVSVATALPGWTAYISTNQQTQVGFNFPCIGSTCISLLGTNPPFGVTLEGGYSVLLQGGVIAAPGGVLFPATASLRQTGLVPASSLSITFKAVAGGGIFSLSLDGVFVPYFELATGPNYTIYGGDVSAFAGRTVELGVSLLGGPGANYSNWNLDSIDFSPVAIPEPSSAAMVTVLGTVTLGIRLCRRKKA